VFTQSYLKINGAFQGAGFKKNLIKKKATALTADKALQRSWRDATLTTQKRYSV
jgi:hypothetical protein